MGYLALFILLLGRLPVVLRLCSQCHEGLIEGLARYTPATPLRISRLVCNSSVTAESSRGHSSSPREYCE